MSASAAGVCRDAARLELVNAFLIPEVRADDDGDSVIRYTDFIPAEGEKQLPLMILRGCPDEWVNKRSSSATELRQPCLPRLRGPKSEAECCRVPLGLKEVGQCKSAAAAAAVQGHQQG